MLKIKEYAFATPADLGGQSAYKSVCRRAGLRILPDGYGLLLAETETGDRVTLAAADVGYVRTIATAGPEALAGLELTDEAVVSKFLRRDGWPDDWI